MVAVMFGLAGVAGVTRFSGVLSGLPVIRLTVFTDVWLIIELKTRSTNCSRPVSYTHLTLPTKVNV